MVRKKSSQSPQKTEAIAVRIDPKTKYGLDLLARKQRRSVSSLLEWIFNEALREHLRCTYTRPATLFKGSVEWDEFALNDLWDTDELARLIKLVDYDEDLLTFEEARIWELIKDNAAYWEGSLDEKNREYVWDTTNISKLRLNLVRADLDELKLVAASKKDEDELDVEIGYMKAYAFGEDTPTKRKYAIYESDDYDFLKALGNHSVDIDSEIRRSVLLEWASRIQKK